MSFGPATVGPAPAPTAEEPKLSLVPPPAPRPRPRLGAKLALAALFLLSGAYHTLQSRYHLTPAIFTDELLHSKLAQSIAAGHGLEIRGEPFFFPAPLPALVQAPAWLLGSVPDAYALAKALNAFLMASAVFPAYWLARQLVRPRFALLATGATVAAPGMLYHSYLLSEALAYPVFLLTLAIMLRALTRPSTGWGLAVIGVSLLAVGTRTQFAALPLAYLLAVLLTRRREWRRHALPAGILLLLGALALLSGGAAFGPYLGAALLHYSPVEVLRWGGLTGALLLFSSGWLVVPGAVLGTGSMLLRPRARADAPFGLMAVVIAALFLLQSGLVGALEAERPLERYVIYLVPLIFVAFFAYAERGAPRRRVYVGLALALGLSAWLMPFPSLADYLFSFDSPMLSAYGTLAVWLSHADAATILAGVPLIGSLALVLARVRRRTAVVAAASVALMLLAGAAAYAGDHGMTRRELRAWAGRPPSWLDASGLGGADFLALPAASPHFGWMFEAWNRESGQFLQLGVRDPFNDSFRSHRASIAPDGALLVDGRPTRAGLLLVNDWATAIDLEGTVLLRPREGLTLYRVADAPRVRALAIGVFFDRWAAGTVRYQVWPERPARAGTYHVVLQIPEGYEPREVTLAVDGGARQTVDLDPGRPLAVDVPVLGYPVPVLRITTDGANFFGGGTPNPRIVAMRIPVLEYVPAPSAAPSGRRQTV